MSTNERSTHPIANRNLAEQSLMSTYRRLPVAFESGKGIWLYDDKQQKYLDALSGIGVCNLGHCHPNVNRVIQEQCAKLVHTSNLYQIPQQQALANELKSVSGLDTCFFSNSGAEANEAAIKIARLYGQKKGIDHPAIVVLEHAFHGRTLATLSATANRKVQAGFEPLVSGFVRSQINDIEAIRTIAKNNSNVVAVLIEPIQGEGGIHLCDSDYLESLRQICYEQDWLLMLDEIQTGNGRTGRYFAYQHTNIKPDVVTTAKGLGNGFPIGVCIAGEKACNIFQPGNHGSTFGGNPLACAVGLTVVNTLFDERLIENAQTKGQLLLDLFKERLEGADYIAGIRGKGLMLGIEMTQNCGALVDLALAKGLLINVTADKVIRLLPPLVINEAETQELADRLCKLIKAFSGDDRKTPRKR